MKRTAFVAMFLTAGLLQAGPYSGDPHIDRYDPITGLYFKAVTSTANRSGSRGFSSKSESPSVVNVNIFDPATGVSTLLFKEDSQQGVSVVLFESGFKDGAVEFNGSASHSRVMNNVGVAPRAPKDRLLVGLRDEKAQTVTLWASDKRGGNPARIVVVPDASDWHVDVRNSKIRVVTQVGQRVRIESYDW